MANNPKAQISKETQNEAMKIAKATQTPGQTKEQTKLIAKGIEKGIAFYKKQQKSKTRESGKKHKKALKLKQQSREEATPVPAVVYKQHWLPWLLLFISWAGFCGYVLFF